jgi:hypothetical protein
VRKRLEVCTVDTPSTTYVKAMADMYEDTDGHADILDRKGKLLFSLPGPGVKDPTNKNITTFNAGDGVVTVRNMPGACGCGGLRIINKSGATP